MPNSLKGVKIYQLVHVWQLLNYLKEVDSDI